jgi:hypothetical protein
MAKFAATYLFYKLCQCDKLSVLVLKKVETLLKYVGI